MSDDGFVWMDDGERRGRSRCRARPAEASCPETTPLILSDDGWQPGETEEPTLRFIGEQLGLWIRARWRQARRQVPRWARDKLAERILPVGAIR